MVIELIGEIALTEHHERPDIAQRVADSGGYGIRRHGCDAIGADLPGQCFPRLVVVFYKTVGEIFGLAHDLALKDKRGRSDNTRAGVQTIGPD